MNKSLEVTVAICCYNAAEYLPKLLDCLVQQSCPLPWEILVVDNNSSDHTRSIIEIFSKTSKIPIRYVFESEQGIAYARNRAIDESQGRTFLAFIDADELPDTKWLATAINSLKNHSADCVGGTIDIHFSQPRPTWLSDNLLPFLGQVKHSNTAFQIIDGRTPIWSGNIAYRLSLFKEGSPFDTRYNRKGNGIGGGSDGILFKKLLASNCIMRYEPEMRIIHLIPPEKLTRSYFLKLHFIAGKKAALYEMNVEKDKNIFGIPRYMFLLFVKKNIFVLKLFIMHNPFYMREAMNVSYLLGQMIGLSQKYTHKKFK